MKRWKRRILTAGLLAALFSSAVCAGASTANAKEIPDGNYAPSEYTAGEAEKAPDVEDTGSGGEVQESEVTGDGGMQQESQMSGDGGMQQENQVSGDDGMQQESQVSGDGGLQQESEVQENEASGDSTNLTPLLEEYLPGTYEKVSERYLRSAATSKLQVNWYESLGSVDSGLMNLYDPYDVSIKYVTSSDTSNVDMRGKKRLVYCVEYSKNGPQGEINWDGKGRVSPSVAYLMYWGCRYWEQENVWSGYRTGYGWKYDCIATQFAIHITNGEYSLNTLYSRLKGPKKEQFYGIVKKMVNDSKNSSYYTPFSNGWRTWNYTLSDSTVTWSAQAYNGQDGFATKWITQSLSDGQIDCSEYITARSVSADNGVTVIWQNGGHASAFRLWIPKSKYLELQTKGAKVTATVSGKHSTFLSGWTYQTNNPSKDQMVTILEGGGGTADHQKSVTAEIPRKNISCYIDLQKTDKDTGEEAPQGNALFEGAVYQVQNQEGMVVDKMTTDASGRAVSAPLAPGTYFIQEITAPEGYKLDKTVYSVAFANTDINETIYRKAVRSEEPVLRGHVRLKKLSSGTGKKLAGAVFWLYSSSGDKKGEYTTDENGTFTVQDLVWDNYYFVEKTPPEGYILGEEKLAFSINGDSAGKTVEVEVKNSPREVSLVLGKEIAAGDINFANGNPIFFFRLEGTDVEGNSHVRHVFTEFTPDYVKKNTTENGTVRAFVTIEGIKAGTYRAAELEVMRYSLADIKEIEGGTKDNDSVIFDLIKNDSGGAVFVNQKDEWSDWSDTSVCVNEIPGKGNEGEK